MGTRSNTELVNQDFREALEKRVGSLEQKTSIEFVPVIVRRSSSYAAWRMLFATLFTLAGASLLIGFEQPVTIYVELGGLCFSLLFFYVLFSWDALLRLCIPSSVLHEEVEEGALRAFLHEEVFATRQRTGLLIFVSIFERGVFVLADKGFREKVDGAHWSQMAAKLARDFNRRNPGETFLEAISELTAKVEKDFPASANNPNELPNGLRTR